MNIVCLALINAAGDALVWVTDPDNEIRACVATQSGPIGVGESYTTSTDGHILLWNWNGSLLRAVATYIPEWDEFNDIFITNDSLISVGITYATGTPDGFILMTDTLGNPGWQAAIGGTDAESFEGVSGQYICGCTRSWDAGEDDIFLLRMQNSSIIWSYAIGGTGWDQAKDVITVEGDAVVVGLTESYGDLGQIMVMRVDQFGGIVWCKVFGGTGYDIGLLAALAGNRLIIAGKDGSYGGGILLLAVNLDDGSLIWSRLIRATGYEFPMGILAGEEAIYISGRHTNGGPAFLLKTNADGSLVWDKYIGGNSSDGLAYILIVPDQMVALGYTSSFGFGRRDFLFVSVDLWGYNCVGRDADFASTEIALPGKDISPERVSIEPSMTYLANTAAEISLPGQLWCEGVEIDESSADYPGLRGLYDCTGRQVFSEPKGPGVYFYIGERRVIKRVILK